MQHKALIINLQIKLKKQPKPTPLLTYDINEYKQQPHKLNNIYTENLSKLPNWEEIYTKLIQSMERIYPVKKKYIYIKQNQKVKTIYYNTLTDLNYKLYGEIKERNFKLNLQTIHKYLHIWKSNTNTNIPVSKLNIEYSLKQTNQDVKTLKSNISYKKVIKANYNKENRNNFIESKVKKLEIYQKNNDMANIWKEIKHIKKGTNANINELITDDNESITNDNKLLRYIINDIDKMFHKDENTITNSIENQIKIGKYPNDQFTEIKYRTQTKKRTKSSLWNYLNINNTKHKEYLTNPISEKEVNTAIMSQKITKQ